MLNYDEYSVSFAAALRLVGARVQTILYEDKTHTDLFLQVCMFYFSSVCLGLLEAYQRVCFLERNFPLAVLVLYAVAG